MSPFSVEAFALDELADMLAAIASDADLDHEQRMNAVFAAFMVSPHLWPLDHTLFEGLLLSSGLDLSDSRVLDSAVLVGAQLEGSGQAPLTCDHRGRTALCSRMAIAHEARANASLSSRAGQYDELLNMRRLRAMGLRWRAAASPAF